MKTSDILLDQNVGENRFLARELFYFGLVKRYGGLGRTDGEHGSWKEWQGPTSVNTGH